jgi:hypothetical protein
MEALFIILGVIIITPVLVLYSSFAWGYVASVIYSWFIIPTFPEAPLLTWVQLAGIMFLVNCFVKGSSTSIKKEYQDNSDVWTKVILHPWLTLLSAWIFKVIIF